MSEEDEDKNKMANRCNEENECPNGSLDKDTQVQKSRGRSKGGQKLVSSGGRTTRTEATGERELQSIPMAQCKGAKCFPVYLPLIHLWFLFPAADEAVEAQGIVGRTPPQSAGRTRSRRTKAPTQTSEFCTYTSYAFYFTLPVLLARVSSEGRKEGSVLSFMCVPPCLDIACRLSVYCTL